MYLFTNAVNNDIIIISLNDISRRFNMRETVTGGALTESTFFILISVYTPNHGYGIMQFVKQKTNGRLILGPGTLYGALKSLVKKGWVSQEIDAAVVDSEKKKLYVITDAGKEAVEEEINRMSEVLVTAIKVINHRES